LFERIVLKNRHERLATGIFRFERVVGQSACCPQVVAVRASKAAWTMADFEALLHELPAMGSPGSDEADLVVVDYMLGSDLCIVLTCPKLF